MLYNRQKVPVIVQANQSRNIVPLTFSALVSCDWIFFFVVSAKGRVVLLVRISTIFACNMAGDDGLACSVLTTRLSRNVLE